MSAKLELLHEKFTSLTKQIKEKYSLNLPCEDLVEELKAVETEMKKTRKILTESNKSNLLND